MKEHLEESDFLFSNQEGDEGVQFTESQEKDAENRFNRDGERTPVVIRFSRVRSHPSTTEREIVKVGDEFVILNTIEQRGRMSKKYSHLKTSSRLDIVKKRHIQSLKSTLDQFVNSPSARVLIYKLLNQNTMNTIRAFVFGGSVDKKGGGFEQIEGILRAANGFPIHPTNSNQHDPDNQHVEITLFSDGRISFRYFLKYDRWSHLFMCSPGNMFKGTFEIVLDMEFSTSNGLRRTYANISYSGKTSDKDNRKALKAEKKSTPARKSMPKSSSEGNLLSVQRGNLGIPVHGKSPKIRFLDRLKVLVSPNKKGADEALEASSFHKARKKVKRSPRMVQGGVTRGHLGSMESILDTRPPLNFTDLAPTTSLGEQIQILRIQQSHEKKNRLISLIKRKLKTVDISKLADPLSVTLRSDEQELTAEIVFQRSVIESQEDVDVIARSLESFLGISEQDIVESMNAISLAE